MDILRRFGVTVAAFMLPAAFLTFGFLLSFGQVLRSPDSLKDALAEGAIYESAVTDLVRQSDGEVNTGPQQAGVLSGQEEVRQAVADAVPAAVLEDHTAQIIDGVYAWLRGETTTPVFQVDLTEIRDTLAVNLSEQAKFRAGQLPPCEPSVTVTLQSFNPFEASCLPAGISPDMVAQKTNNEVLASDLFKDPVLDAQDIQGSDGKQLQEQLKPVSDIYNAVQDFTILGGIAAVGLAAIVVFASKPLHAGLRRLGMMLLGVGVGTVGLALLGGIVMNAIAETATRSSGEAAIQTAIVRAVQLLIGDVRTWWLGFGIVVLLLGAGALVGQYILKKRGSPPESVSAKRTQSSGIKN